MLKILQKSCQGEEEPWQHKTEETQTFSWEMEWEKQTCEKNIGKENLHREFNY